MTIQKLNSLLRDVSAGVVPTSIHRELFKLVVASWGEFSGSGDTSMASHKILRDEGRRRSLGLRPTFRLLSIAMGEPYSVQPVLTGNSGHSIWKREPPIRCGLVIDSSVRRRRN
jgi:hypothetical protein